MADAIGMFPEARQWRTKPPLGTKFLRGRWDQVAPGTLMFASCFNGHGAGNNVNHANGVFPTVTVPAGEETRLIQEASQFGTVLTVDPTSSDTSDIYLDYGDHALYDAAADNRWACVARVRLRPGGVIHSSWPRLIGTLNNGADSLQWGFGLRATGGQESWFSNTEGTGFAYAQHNVQEEEGRWYFLYGGQDGTSAAANNAFMFAYDGLSGTFIASDSQSGASITANPSNLAVGGRYTDDRVFDGDFDFAYAWIPPTNAGMNSATYQPAVEIMRNPYQFFSPQLRLVPTGIASAAGLSVPEIISMRRTTNNPLINM